MGPGRSHSNIRAYGDGFRDQRLERCVAVCVGDYGHAAQIGPARRFRRASGIGIDVDDELSVRFSAGEPSRDNHERRVRRDKGIVNVQTGEVAAPTRVDPATAVRVDRVTSYRVALATKVDAILAVEGDDVGR